MAEAGETVKRLSQRREFTEEKKWLSLSKRFRGGYLKRKQKTVKNVIKGKKKKKKKERKKKKKDKVKVKRKKKKKKKNKSHAHAYLLLD